MFIPLAIRQDRIDDGWLFAEYQLPRRFDGPVATLLPSSAVTWRLLKHDHDEGQIIVLSNAVLSKTDCR